LFEEIDGENGGNGGGRNCLMILMGLMVLMGEVGIDYVLMGSMGQVGIPRNDILLMQLATFFPARSNKKGITISTGDVDPSCEDCRKGADSGFSEFTGNDSLTIGSVQMLQGWELKIRPNKKGSVLS
jgi:hypothetical protein